MLMLLDGDAACDASARHSAMETTKSCSESSILSPDDFEVTFCSDGLLDGVAILFDIFRWYVVVRLVCQFRRPACLHDAMADGADGPAEASSGEGQRGKDIRILFDAQLLIIGHCLLSMTSRTSSKGIGSKSNP
jgi:hypothetical protein